MAKTTSRSAWKQRERAAAGLFGAKRQPCSGSSGRDDQTRSDSTHPRLFVETKLKANHAVRTLFDKTRELARKEGKTAVLALASKHKPGVLVCIHSDDLAAVLREFAVANDLPADINVPPGWPPQVGRAAEPEDLFPLFPGDPSRD